MNTKGLGAVRFHDVSGRAILELRGRDSFDLLQRISTNDLAGLNVGHARPTILVTEKGRIVDVINVLKLSETRILLAAEGPARPSLHAWLEKFIFADDAAVGEQQLQWRHLFFWLPFPDDPARNTPNQSKLKLLVSNMLRPLFSDSCYVFDPFAGSGAGVHCLFPSRDAAAMASLLYSNGFQEKPPIEYDCWRIAAGIPAFGTELTLEYHPRELSLDHLVSDTKGCYPGQEVLARLDTYHKVSRRLVRVYLHGCPGTLTPPLRLYADNREAGTLTSVSGFNDGIDGRQGLAIVKQGFLQVGMDLRIQPYGTVRIDRSALVTPKEERPRK